MDYSDVYVPTHKYGPVEEHLSESGMPGRIYDISELNNFSVSPQALFAQFAQAAGWAIIGGCRRLGVTYPIHFCLVRSDVRNAMAIRFDHWACIVISDGLAVQLYYLINALSQSRYFVGYRETHTQFEAAFKYPLTKRRITMEYLTAFRTINLRQGFLNKTLTAMGMMFFASHELAHIVNGHLGSGLVGAALAEDQQIVGASDLQVFRTLEYDADALGMQLALHYCLDVVGNAGDSTEFLKDELDAVHTIFAGVYVAMLVIEAVQIVTPEDFHGYTHPPAIFRLFAVSSVVENAVGILRARGLGSLSPIAVHDALDRVTRSIEWAVADRARAAPDPDTLVTAVTLKATHDAEIYKCWARIRPQLEKQKLGHHKLAAAQYDLDGRPLRPRSFRGASRRKSCAK